MLVSLLFNNLTLFIQALFLSAMPGVHADRWRHATLIGSVVTTIVLVTIVSTQKDGDHISILERRFRQSLTELLSEDSSKRSAAGTAFQRAEGIKKSLDAETEFLVYKDPMDKVMFHVPSSDDLTILKSSV
jgi:hypothetical protein